MMEFITLTTGATAMSSRDEVADDVIAKIVQALAVGMRQERDHDPVANSTLWAGWSVAFSRRSGKKAASFQMLLHEIPMSRCLVCWDKVVSDEAWELVQDAVPDRVVAHRPRGVPWLAVDILPAAVDHPSALWELADAERCVAWALIEIA